MIPLAQEFVEKYSHYIMPSLSTKGPEAGGVGDRYLFLTIFKGSKEAEVCAGLR